LGISDESKKKIIDLYLNTQLKHSQILAELNPDEGVTIEDLVKVLEEYQKSVGHDITRKKRKRKCNKNNNKTIDNEDIFNMVENGFDDGEIKDYYMKKGCSISRQAINSRKQYVYKMKGLPVPNIKKMREMDKRKQKEAEDEKKREEIEQKNNEIDEVIKNLRENGYSFIKIRDELRKDDVHLGCDTIENRYLAYCENNGIKPVELRYRKGKAKNINKDKVYELKEKGYKINQIAKVFDVTPTTMSIICKKIYAEKNEEMKKSYDEKIDVSKEELVELKDVGFSVRSICKYYKNKGIEVSDKIISKKLHKAYSELGRKMPNANEKKKTDKIDLKYVDKSVLKGLIDNLKETKNASDMQIEELYKYYGIGKVDKAIEER
jgi:DNA-binding transcriptional MerR regulator